MPNFQLYDKVSRVRDNLRKVIRGKDEVIELLLTAVLAEGHVLLDDVPGVGKTTLAKALAKSVECEFKRIQFTPDMMPSDILGAAVFNQKTSEFTFHQGPIFSNIVLGDEINRASPRTQSAMLEAMNERQISIDGRRCPLPKPFLVIATENPVEYFGTFPLPEAQLDRFAMQFSLGYPDKLHEIEILSARETGDPLDAIKAELDRDELKAAQEDARAISIESSVLDFLLSIVRATRDPDCGLRLGASPRAALDLARCVRARAWLDRRDYATPDDASALAIPVLAHRLVPNAQSRHAGLAPADILSGILKRIPVPV